VEIPRCSRILTDPVTRTDSSAYIALDDSVHGYRKRSKRPRLVVHQLDISVHPGAQRFHGIVLSTKIFGKLDQCSTSCR